MRKDLDSKKTDGPVTSPLIMTFLTYFHLIKKKLPLLIVGMMTVMIGTWDFGEGC